MSERQQLLRHSTPFVPRSSAPPNPNRDEPMACGRQTTLNHSVSRIGIVRVLEIMT